MDNLSKTTFNGENFYLHLFKRQQDNDYEISFGSTYDLVYPKLSKEELKELADFIYKYLENE